ncbi:hypothetical protein PVAP13_8KG160100 [Panicum virgatum]|uniref:Uncharacterized protein n=1 Tax=Panicum virgatum TaxID=38727 RepID=A0A8T0PMA5_PANVG|nr:hypothetical protein PVAP13_8KG160100 [Panicum virgatum]
MIMSSSLLLSAFFLYLFTCYLYLFYHWGNIYVADAMNMAIRKISDTDLSAFLELFSASFSAYPAGGSGNIPGGSVQGNKTVRGLRFSAILS